MFDLILFILKCEVITISEEIVREDVFVCFDGTTSLGEAVAIVLHFVDDQWNIKQRFGLSSDCSKEFDWRAHSSTIYSIQHWNTTDTGSYEICKMR